MADGDVVPALDLDSDGAIAAISQRVGWVIAYDVNVTKLVSDLASEAGHVVNSFSVVDRTSSSVGDIPHEVSAVVAVVA